MLLWQPESTLFRRKQTPGRNRVLSDMCKRKARMPTEVASLNNMHTARQTVHFCVIEQEVPVVRVALDQRVDGEVII